MLSTTWVYISALMTIAIFVKFHRLWSVRNLDLIGLILFGFGLLYLAMGELTFGFRFLVGLCVLFMVRMIFDTIMVRRPLLEPNLTSGGLSFACIALFAFLVAATCVNRGVRVDSLRTVRLDQITTTRASLASTPDIPGLIPFQQWTRLVSQMLLPAPEMQQEILRQPSSAESDERQSRDDLIDSVINGGVLDSLPEKTPIEKSPAEKSEKTSEKSSREFSQPDSLSASTKTPYSFSSLAVESESALVVGLVVIVISHLMIALGLWLIGIHHFGSFNTGLACATLYLLLPYTHQMVGRIDHFLPAAILVWCIFCYRYASVAGLLLGLASGLVFYPIFLVPLWGSFYARRGLTRFVIGLVVGLLLMLSVLFMTQTAPLYDGLTAFFGIPALFGEADGLWIRISPLYRVPVMAAFGALCLGMAIWPSHKHLATLLCCTTFIMLGVQCWQPFEGGLTLAWFLPTMILTFFRPNLEDRTASATVL